MAKNYGRRVPNRQKTTLFKQLILMLAAFLIGYLTATLFDFTSVKTWINSHLLAKKNEETPVVKPTANLKEPRPKFEFYTLLAKDQHRATISSQPPPPPAKTVVSNPTLAASALPAVIEAKVASAVSLSKESYVVQIASFKNRADAERLKAVLTLKGFDVLISTTSQQQTNWFRVALGPFSSRPEAEKMQIAIANSERIRGMVRKMDA